MQSWVFLSTIPFDVLQREKVSCFAAAIYTVFLCSTRGPGYLTYHCQAAHEVLDGQGDANGDHAVHAPHLTRSLRTLDLLAAASEVLQMNFVGKDVLTLVPLAKLLPDTMSKLNDVKRGS